MAELPFNQPVTTSAPTVTVTTQLPVGRHRFELVVIDDSKNRSVADRVDVIVADQAAPTAVLVANPNVVGIGQFFELDGSQSRDAGGGSIVQYVWTYRGSVSA